jgi:hypothetical protein
MRINWLGITVMIWVHINKNMLNIIQIVSLLVESHMEHQTVTVNHIKTVANHIV